MPITLTKADTVWKITVQDVEHELRAGDITPAQAGALRQQSHGAWRVPTLFDAIGEGIGPEEITGLVFLARRQRGDEVTYDAVADEIGALPAGAVITLDFATDEADPEDEAPEG